MLSFGATIRRLRNERKLSLRMAASDLGIGQAILSKIERGQQAAALPLLVKLASYYNIDLKDLLQWHPDKLSAHVEEEELANLEALKMAEPEQIINYQSLLGASYEVIVKNIQNFFQDDKRVSKAWIFGSFARKEDKPGSDIDIMVRYSDAASGTLFDYSDIQFKLEQLLKRKVDLVEDGYIKPFALKEVSKDLKLIYG